MGQNAVGEFGRYWTVHPTIQTTAPLSNLAPDLSSGIAIASICLTDGPLHSSAKVAEESPPAEESVCVVAWLCAVSTLILRALGK